MEGNYFANYVLWFPFLDEGSVPSVVPDLSGVAVDAEHAVSVACVEYFDGVVAVEGCCVAYGGSWVVQC